MNELAQNPVVAKFATTATDGKVYQVEYYSLDVILSVGYRVKSSQGILFRRWANLVLSLISRSKRSLMLIDNWATAATLDLFAIRGIKKSAFVKGVL